MKKYKRWISYSSVIMIIFCFLPSLLHAQPGPGGDPDVTVPVDGGLSILAAAGIAYGVKKIKSYRKLQKKID